MDREQKGGMRPERENRRVTHRTRRSGRTTQPRAPRTDVPEVTYTPPKPVNRTQMLLRLLTVVAVVAAITFGVSIFFKVKYITVTGVSKYTAWEVSEASKIKEGDNLLFFGKGRASGNILAELPYVKSAQIGIKLPDTVRIAVEEQDVTYAMKDPSGDWWMISADGRIMGSVTSADAAKTTIIKGVTLDEPAAGQMARAAIKKVEESPDEETTETQQPETFSPDMQLKCVLEILQELEKNGLFSGFSSLDVTSLADIEMWYGDRYQISVGDSARIPYKMKCLSAAINQLETYQSGILDVSFTIWPDEVGYTPFE